MERSGERRGEKTKETERNPRVGAQKLSFQECTQSALKKGRVSAKWLERVRSETSGLFP